MEVEDIHGVISDQNI